MAKRHFLAGVPHVNLQVMAVQRMKRLDDEVAQPDERWHDRLGKVLRGAAGDLEVGVLEHVGRIDSPLQPSVKAQPDHPPSLPGAD